MITKNIKVKVASETDARTTAMLVQTASRFKSSIHIACDNNSFNAKSIMGMMALGLTTGKELTITAEGEDEETAMEQITEFLTGSRFD